jgi:hypothetical protein
MRVWGRVPVVGGIRWSEVPTEWSLDTNTYSAQLVNPNNLYEWQEVTTDANGYNDAVYVTALCQVLQLQTGESPFYSQYGIPAQQSIAQQVFPDYNVFFIQQQYARYFASLKITKVNQNNQYGVPEPVYNVNVITQQGSIINLTVPIPT